MTIGLASDHAGFSLKQYVKRYLDERGIAYHDYGTMTEESCDYADYGHALAFAVERGEVTSGIAICGSGEGIAMTVNKHQGIRAGLCWTPEIAHLIRQHNNANILTLPARFISAETAEACVDVFLQTAFEGGRHARRVEKISMGIIKY